MIEQIREKNSARLVTSAFRSKFLRTPSPAELSHWLAILQADADFQRFLRQITHAVANDQPLSGVAIARALPTVSATLNLTFAEKQRGLSPVIQNEAQLLLDEEHGVTEAEWLSFLEVVIQKNLFDPLLRAGTPPPKVMLWICIDTPNSVDEVSFYRTINSLDHLHLASEYPIGVVILAEQIVLEEGSVVKDYIEKNSLVIVSSTSELARHIRREDLVLFVKPGDEIRPELHMALKYFGSFKNTITLIDMYFRDNEKIYPLLLHGIDYLHAKHVDYFFSRIAMSGAIIQDITNQFECKGLNKLISIYFQDYCSVKKSQVHINVPLLCINIDKKLIMDRKLEITRNLCNTFSYPTTIAIQKHDISFARVSVIICTKNATYLLRQLISCLLIESVIIDIVVVSNNTDNPLAKLYLDDLSFNNKIKILCYDEAFNFSEQCNLGAKCAIGDILLFLNDDICPITDNWLPQLLQTLTEHSINETVVGPLLLYPDQSVQHAGMYMGFNNVAGHTLRHAELAGPDNTFLLHAPRQVSCLTGAALIMSRQLFENLNGFDPMLATYLQDVDFSLRVINSGFRLVFEPRALLFHMESISVKPELQKEHVGKIRGNEYRYFSERWGPMIHTDEWMNPLFDQSDESLRSLKV